MASLKITTPDGKTLRVNIPEGTDPAQYDAMANEAVQHYMASKGPQLMGDLTPSTGSMDVNDQGNVTTNPISEAGKAVEAGYTGLADLATLKGLPTAAANVENVMNDQAPTTASGKVGRFAGSFFTPVQIALQATGAAAAPYVAKGLGAVARPVTKFAAGAFPKISKVLGASPEAIGALVDNPEAVRAAKSMPEVAEDVASTVRGLSQKGMDVAKAGKTLLSSTKPVAGLEKSLMSYADEIATSPAAEEADQLAAKYVREFAEKIKGKVSEKEVGALIDSLDEKIGAKWAKANPTLMVETKEGIRRLLSRALQAQNKEYAAAMAESASTFGPTEALSKNLALREGVPSDSTIPALKKVIDPEALATQRALSSFPAMSGQVANAAAKAALQESLLGRTALGIVPNLGPITEGVVQAAPALSNAIYQGLLRGQF